MKKPLLLMILDGWGINPNPAHNAVALANTPNLTRLLAEYPHVADPLLRHGGRSARGADGQLRGRAPQHRCRPGGLPGTDPRHKVHCWTAISSPIRSCWTASAKTKAAGGRLHLSGLLSDGGVHSHNTHLYALLELARREGLSDVFVHCLLDGRDTPPQSGIDYLAQLEAEIARIGCGRIATVMGRYYAMDRDNRWDRVEKAYNAMVHGLGELCVSSKDAIEQSYASRSLRRICRSRP